MGQLDLADEPVERRMDGRTRVAEPLRRPHEPAQVIEAHAGLDGRGRRVGKEAVPAAHQSAAGPDGEVVALLDGPVGRRHGRPVDAHDELARGEERPIGVTHPRTHAPRVELAIDLPDLDAHVAAGRGSTGLGRSCSS